MRGFELGLGFAVCSLVVLSCSGDEAGTTSVSPETACDQTATALCDKLQECAPFLVTVGVADRAQCIARFKINCPSSFTATGTGATPARLSQCARDMKAASCEDVLGRTPPESCRTVAGTLEDGAVCGHDAQCKNKLCRVADNSACGACSSLGGAGATCKRDEECDYGLKCQGEKCVAFGKSGDPCSASQPCHPTLGCNEGRCAPMLAAGAACKFVKDENPCDFTKGYYCHPRNAVCAQVETAPPGGTCELSVDRITACTSGATCRIPPGETTGPCEAAAADGAPCDEAKGPKCIGPARCNAGVCTIVDPATCK